MLQSVRLINFFSFKDCLIPFHEGANVLLGINGSGKSNIMKAIRLLKEGVAGKGLPGLLLDDWGGFEEVYFKGGGENAHPNSFILEFTFDPEKISGYGYAFLEPLSYLISIMRLPGTSNYYVQEKVFIRKSDHNDYIYLDFSNGKGVLNERESLGKTNGKSVKHAPPKLVRYQDKPSDELVLGTIFDTDRYFPLATLRKAISEIEVYEYFDTSPNSKMRRSVKASGERKLRPDGGNLPQILNTIKITDKPSFRKLSEHLKKVNENFKGFDFLFQAQGNLELLLDEENLNTPVHVAHLSDGTLRYLCLLAIIFNPNRGSLICIDEPEVGLHPDMLRLIASGIRETAEETQMIVASHSENFLNSFELEEIRVFEKDSENATQVFQFSEEDFQGWYESFSPGAMWRAGDLGGNRY